MTTTLGCIYSRRITKTSTGNPKVYWETTFNGELITAPSLKKCRELVALRESMLMDFLSECFTTN